MQGYSSATRPNSPSSGMTIRGSNSRVSNVERPTRGGQSQLDIAALVQRPHCRGYWTHFSADFNLDRRPTKRHVTTNALTPSSRASCPSICRRDTIPGLSAVISMSLARQFGPYLAMRRLRYWTTRTRKTRQREHHPSLNPSSCEK